MNVRIFFVVKGHMFVSGARHNFSPNPDIKQRMYEMAMYFINRNYFLKVSFGIVV